MIFSFFIGGYFSNHFQIELVKNTLQIWISEFVLNSKGDPNYQFDVHEDEEWNALTTFLSSLDWRSKYGSEILDGIQWELRYKNDNQNIQCHGSNAYPSEFGVLTQKINGLLAKYSVPIIGWCNN